jgi:hypothetical protein
MSERLTPMSQGVLNRIAPDQLAQMLLKAIADAIRAASTARLQDGKCRHSDSCIGEEKAGAWPIAQTMR